MSEVEIKPCSRCKLEPRTYPRHSWCRTCLATDQRDRRRRVGQHFFRYGLTKGDMESMRLMQGDRCAVCSTGLNDDAQVDHDHSTGHVRALLCRFCNRGLGQFRDNPTSLRAAATYLEMYGV